MKRTAEIGLQKIYGTLATKDDALIVRPLTNATQTAAARFDPKTLEARSPSPRLLTMPAKLCKEIGAITRDNSPQELRQKASTLYKSLGKGESHRQAFSSLEADAHIQATILQNYASISQVLLETKARIPNWSPRRVLDIGFGPATGLLVANEIFDSLERKVSVIFGHYKMKRRAMQLLRTQEQQETENEAENAETRTIFKDHVPAVTATTSYDLIIATHQLYQSGPHNTEVIDSHAKRLTNLLSPGGVLIFVERGDAFGFESIARARQVIMRPEDVADIRPQFISRRQYDKDAQLKIIAPCAHQGNCPLQIGLGRRQLMSNPGSENWCRFSQNVQRPKFALEFKKGRYLAQQWEQEQEGVEKDYGEGKGGKSLAGKGRPNGQAHEVANHSYLVIQRAEKPNTTSSPSPNLARILRNPQKHKGHVTMEVCAPTGQIEHWTVAKSQGKVAYHDARKASQGDNWALGAKSVQIRGGLSAKVHELPEEPTTVPKTDAAPVDLWASNEEDLDPLDLLTSNIPETEVRSQKLNRKDRQTRYRAWSE